MHSKTVQTLMKCDNRGRSSISGKGAHMYKGVGDSLCKFYHIFLKYPMNMKTFSLRPNYSILIGYSKTGGGGGGGLRGFERTP